MEQWWDHLRRGPAGPAILVCVVVVAAAVRFAPARETAGPRVYRTGNLPAEPLVNVPIGALEGASAHHLRVEERVVAHLHRRHDETVVVLAGHGHLRLGEEVVEVGRGVVIQVPRGTVHSLEVEGDPVEAVSVFSPPFDGTDRVIVDE